MNIKGTVPDMYIFGLLRTELCRPGVVYDTRAQLVQAVRDMEVKFNDPNHVFNQGLENAFLGSYFSENGQRKGGKKLNIPGWKYCFHRFLNKNLRYFGSLEMLLL